MMALASGIKQEAYSSWKLGAQMCYQLEHGIIKQKGTFHLEHWLVKFLFIDLFAWNAHVYIISCTCFNWQLFVNHGQMNRNLFKILING